ncbi:MAG: hypothetical protein ACFFB3_13960 [Candidatus Hodarchaeota archaeon]
MALEVSEFLSETRIFNRRFLVGIFFPTFSEILFLHLLLLKSLPNDVTPVLFLAGFATGVSLVLERFAGRSIWIGAFCGGHYRRERKEFFEEKIEEDSDLTSLLISNYIEDLEMKARGSYLGDFWARKNSYELEALERAETDYLLGFFFLLYGVIDLFLVSYLSAHSIDLVIYERDTIESNILILSLISFLLVWNAISFFYLANKRGRLNRRIFTNLPVPYRERREDIRETKYYIQSMEALLKEYPEGSEMYKANCDLIRQFRQRQFQKELIDRSALILAEDLSEALPKQILTEKRLGKEREAELREAGEAVLIQEISQQRLDRSFSPIKIREIAEHFVDFEEKLTEILENLDWSHENPEDIMELQVLVKDIFLEFEQLSREALGISRVTTGFTIPQLSQLWGISSGEAQILTRFTALKNQLTQTPWDPHTTLDEVEGMKNLTMSATRLGQVMCAFLLAQEEPLRKDTSEMDNLD